MGSMEKIKILGIAGSPRKGNTEYAVQKALEAAESIGNVVIEFVTLRGKLVKPCMADYKCFKKGTPEVPCTAIPDDDGNEIIKKMLEADAILVGTPVYFGGPSAQIKALFDRTIAIEALGITLRHKVGGVIAVGYERNGGLEPTLFDMIRSMMVHDMIIVGVGPERPGKTGMGTYWGGICTQGFPYPIASPTKESRTGVLQDVVGINSVMGLGKKMAEVAKLVKAGLHALSEEELAWPRNAKMEMHEKYANVEFYQD
jgi:multimeric flavodoxin WrbA